MKRGSGIIAAAVVLFAASTVRAGGVKPIDPMAALSALGDGSLAGLSGSLRGLLIHALPSPLYTDDSHWGRQKEVQVGVTWKGQGLHVHPEPRTKLKNHGKWWRVRVTAPNLADTLVFDLREVQTPESGRLLMTAFVSFDADVDYDREVWDEGVRLYSAGVRARMRVKLTLQCEATSRLEKTDVLPEMVFRLRVVKADCAFDNFVVEHIAGVGGEVAKLVGDAARGGLKQWHPSFERHLLEKADAAIVKAADTKEVRLGLSKLFGKK
jgi:hypothetical protein